MQPLGRHTIRFSCKRDCHPPKGWRNWWEAECNNGDEHKAREKRLVMKEINEQLQELKVKDD